ncbi:hypothetical protein Tco_0665442 [Tanacetum coccineum]
MLDEYNHYITYKADKLLITKISYKINRVTKDAIIRIERNKQPLSLTVYEKFMLKQQGFIEWIEIHSLAFKVKSKSNDLLLRNLKAKGKREEEFHLTTTAQLIRHQNTIQRGCLEAEEMFTKLELTIKAKNDVTDARKVLKDSLSAKPQRATTDIFKSKTSSRKSKIT